MKINKLLMSSLLLVGTMSSLASCNKDNFTGLTINFWHSFGQTVVNGLENSASDFAKIIKEKEGVDLRVKFTYKGGYDDVLGEVGKSLAVGGNPTIAVAYPDHVADYFAFEGNNSGKYVVNLQPYAESSEYGFATEPHLGDRHGMDDFVQSFIDESTHYYKEGMYSIPFLKSTEVMLYNVDLMQSALKIIEGGEWSADDVKEYLEDISWEDFMDLCQSIKDHMRDISSTLEIPCVYDSDGNLFISQLYQREIPYAGLGSNPNSGYIGFNGKSDGATAEQVKAYQDVQDMLAEYKGWYDKGLFTTKGVQGQYSSYFFTPQKTIFAIGSCGGSGYSFPSSAEFKVGCVKVPYSNNNPLYVSQGPTLTVLHNTKLQQSGEDDKAVLYAWKFIKYITNEEVNARQCTLNSEGYIPVRTSAYNTDQFRKFIDSDTDYVVVTKMVITDIDGRYFSSPVFKGSAALRKYCEGCFADVLKGQDTIKNILDKTIDQAILSM